MSRGSGFKTPAAGAGLLRVAVVQAKARDREAKPAKPRKPMKSSRPKMTAIRASARGQDCTLRFPGICNRNPERALQALGWLKVGQMNKTEAAYAATLAHRQHAGEVTWFKFEG
jgi:hypothetical protein